jgi:DNA-binding MurR/RpiR family transcriptional regulator
MHDGLSIQQETFAARMARLGGSLGAAGQRVAGFIARKPATVLAGSALELAANAGTSDATVIRTIQTLGYAGLADLKRALAASLDLNATPADDMRRTLADLGEDAMQSLDTIMAAHAEALETLRSEEFREQMGRALRVLHAAERVVVFGIGPSAALARYVAVLLARAGRRSRCLDATGITLADRHAYRELTGLFAEARRLRLPIVLVSETADSRLAKSAEVVLTIPRGKGQRVALHGGTLVALEAMVLALAAAGREQALATLERLNRLRIAVSGQHHDVG